METQTEQEKTTYTLWTFKDYKDNVINNYKYNIQRRKQNIERKQRELNKIKQELRELKQMEIPKLKISKEEYKQILETQRNTAREFNSLIIENKDSEVLKE